MLTSCIFWFAIICITSSVFMCFSTMFYVLLFQLSDFILLSSEFFLVNFFVVFIVFLRAAAFCMITFSLVHFFKNVLEINKYSSKRKFFMLNRRSSLDWSRQVESSRLSRVLDSSRLDSSQNFEIEYSSRVRILISSIRVESRCWYRVLTRILDSTRQDMIYFY